jgi:hypothetical protein
LVPGQSPLLRRIDDLLERLSVGTNQVVLINEALQTAYTLAAAIYGPNNTTLSVLTRAEEKAHRSNWATHLAVPIEIGPAVIGVLRSMKADLEAGIIGSVERRAAGAVLADMLGLAREALADGDEGSKNVAAVLTAAAYEDTIRRMGVALAGVQGRPDLADVLTALKKADVLRGAPLSTAQGYLKFRNDALHADWSRLDRAVVGSCLTFVQELLLAHLS